MSTTLRDDVTFTSTEYGAILLDLRDGHYWQLSRTAALIVRALQEGRGRDGALVDLQRQFDVDAERLARDLDSLLEQLLSTGLAVR